MDERTKPNGENKHFRWQDGMPTGPDVSALIKAFPDLKIGDRIEYEQIEVILSLERRDTRFRTITNAWRKRLLEEGKVIHCERNAAFLVATCEQITARTTGVLQHVQRAAKGQRQALSTVRTDNPVELATVEHHGRLLLAIERDTKKARMNVIPDTTVRASPQITPPKAKAG